MSTQTWNPDDYHANARFVTQYGSSVLDLLGDLSGKRVLDIGCGDGPLTLEIVQRGASAVATDSSLSMIAKARELGLDARVLDARELPFEGEFDAVFTNAALHWIQPLKPVVQGVARALKPGGRFAGECGGHGNVAAICTALRGALTQFGYDPAGRSPWHFPTLEEFSGLLEGAGLEIEQIVLFPRPTPLPTDMRGWMRTMAMSYFSGCREEDVEPMLDAAISLVEPSLCDDQGRWTADYVRLRFLARKG